MNRLRLGRLRPDRRRIAGLALPLACLLPLNSTARVELNSDNGSDTPTGDPLDANDFGSGGGLGGRQLEDPGWPGVQTSVLPAPVIDGRRILLVPVNQGGFLTFKLVIIDERKPATEAADAR